MHDPAFNMKALVYHGTKDLRYEDFPEPRMLPGNVRLRPHDAAP